MRKVAQGSRRRDERSRGPERAGEQITAWEGIVRGRTCGAMDACPGMSHTRLDSESGRLWQSPFEISPQRQGFRPARPAVRSADIRR